MPAIKAPMQVVDALTGEVKEEKTVDWHIMPCDTSQGQCPACAIVHNAADPHNQQSMYYQYTFFAQHSRWPNWVDAMAHCDAETQAKWKAALIERGVTDWN
jgi:hypothetical protein